MIAPVSKSLRRHDLDWIRVIAVMLLLFFHTGMLFTAEWDWHIKNDETSNLLLEGMHFLSGWRMGLLFFVSGAGTFFALGFRSPTQYLRERGKRLLIPLLFGVAVIVPPQIYFERLFRAQVEPGYFSFWPMSLLSLPYPAGDLSWHHLWFVFYLFLYSLLTLPLLLAWRQRTGRLMAHLIQRPRPLLLGIGVTYACVYALLTIPFPGPQNLVNDWGRFCSYLVLFGFGFLAQAQPALGEALKQQRRFALQWGILCAFLLYALRWNQVDWTWGMNSASVGYMVLRGLTGFWWMTAILGYARVFLNRGGALLRYANEAVYPFYILHQTVIIVVGYYVVSTSDTVLAKFLFTSLLSFAISMALYELFIRNSRWLRPLFGLKEMRRP